MEHCRLPQWMFGWAVFESIKRHPSVLTASQIQRSIGISEKASLMLKRRIQIFASEQKDRIRDLIFAEMKKEFKDFLLPTDGTDIRKIAERKNIVHADSMVLWSASVRANKGRKRHRSKGLTSSIYMSDKLGGKQVGTLVHVMGTEQGWCVLDSVSDQKANTIGTIFRKYLPPSTAIFTDEGYQWLYRVYRNHRMVNHSLKSKDPRWRLSTERWSKNGVCNSIAEGLNSSLKNAFASYKYTKPEYSQMYLNEWSFFKNLNYFGFEKIAKRAKVKSSGNRDCGEKTGGIRRRHNTTDHTERRKREENRRSDVV